MHDSCGTLVVPTANTCSPWRSASARLWAIMLTAVLPVWAHAAQGVAVPNGDFEQVDTATSFAQGWIRGFGPDTQATAEVDDAVAHAGRCSLRITDATPTDAYKYALVNTQWLEVQPRTTYVLRCYVRGRGVGKSFLGMAFEGAGEHRQGLPAGDYDWREVTCRVTVPAGCSKVSIQFVADGVTRMRCGSTTWCWNARRFNSANMREVQYPRTFSSWYPRTPGAVPRSLLVLDIQSGRP